MAKRFYKFFPWIFVLAEIIVVSFALLITLGVIKYFGIIHFINHTIYPVFIMVWLVISVLRKDYKIGRTTEAMQTLQQLIGSLIWFLAIMSLIWMPFKN
jgi:putative colanic acid biosysnthesis UDP-glucose lipid carrier transferase